MQVEVLLQDKLKSSLFWTDCSKGQSCKYLGTSVILWDNFMCANSCTD